jgi:hypothetical protein
VEVVNHPVVTAAARSRGVGHDEEVLVLSREGGDLGAVYTGRFVRNQFRERKLPQGVVNDVRRGAGGGGIDEEGMNLVGVEPVH